MLSVAYGTSTVQVLFIVTTLQHINKLRFLFMEIYFTGFVYIIVLFLELQLTTSTIFKITQISTS